MRAALQLAALQLAAVVFTSTKHCTLAFSPSTLPSWKTNRPVILFSTEENDDAPSDYDTSDLLPTEKQVSIDTDPNDALIRDELKRELLLLASVTNRGEFASREEKDILVDLVTQLEALNPSADPARQCEGEWDLCLCSTQAFRSSPFFQSIRAIFGDDSNAMIAENAFDLHDQATSVGKVGKVRQSIKGGNELISEVDLEVGLMGGLPFALKGTVVTTASIDITGPETWETRVKTTQVKGSNLPFLDQFLDDYPVEVPVGEFYDKVRGDVPVAKLKTFYIDEGLRSQWIWEPLTRRWKVAPIIQLTSSVPMSSLPLIMQWSIMKMGLLSTIWQKQ